MEEYLSVQDAARRRNVSPATIYKAIHEGRLKAVRMLGRFAILPADIDAFEAASYAGVKRAVKTRGVPRKQKSGKP